MPSCSLCGVGLPVGDICPLHSRMEDGWAQANKTWCDFIHRGVEIPRLPPTERDDPQPAYTE